MAMLLEGWDVALEECYEAVAYPELWGTALGRLAQSCGATGAMFYPKDVNENATFVPFSNTYGELLEEYVSGHWYENHYRALRGWPLLTSGRMAVITEHDLATDDERKRLPQFNELYSRFGLPGFAAIGFTIDDKP